MLSEFNLFCIGLVLLLLSFVKSTNTNTIPALWYFNTIQYVLFICVGHGWVQLLTGLSEQEAAGNTQDQQDFFGGEWSWRGTTLLMEIIFKTDYIFVVPRDDPDKQSGSQTICHFDLLYVYSSFVCRCTCIQYKPEGLPVVF